jgi:hypothetical protein
MKPANGNYRLTQVTPPGGGTCEVRVTDTSMLTPIGNWLYSPGMDLFTLGPTIAVECHGDGTYSAVNGPTNVTGTCVFLGP